MVSGRGGDKSDSGKSTMKRYGQTLKKLTGPSWPSLAP